MRGPDSATQPASTIRRSRNAAKDGRLEVTFGFPDAVQMGANDPETRWRSIKLQAAGVVTSP